MTWKREPLTESELETLTDAADARDLEHQVAVYTLAYTGLRADEYAHMVEDWIEWQDERLRVPPEKDGWTPKTDHAARTIPIKHPPTLRRLRDWFSYHGRIGVSRQTVHSRVTRVAQDTDIRKKVTPHTLRHTYGTMIARRGATPQYIRQTMGHADLSSANNYLEYAGTQLDAEAEELF